MTDSSFAPFPSPLQQRLQGFDPRKVPVFRFDLVVVGGGAGGASAALAAAEAGLSVAVLVKKDLLGTNTNEAKGGMAAVLAEGDSFELHAGDTLKVGCGLSDAITVEAVVRGGPSAVAALQLLGAKFDVESDGSLHLSREGGHSRPRIFHAGDATGLVIQKSLSRALEDHANVTVFPNHFALDLLKGETGRVDGVLALREGTGRRFDPAKPPPHVAFAAGHVLLATGGAGQLYRETTNPEIATGDGIALGLRAGAIVRDMEFFQFHPTCLYIAGAARVLISEIVRGAGGLLIDKHGERFMPAAHDDAELAPRDVVSRACFERMVETEDTSVYLDLSQVEGNPHELFPAVSRICGLFGINIAIDPVPVRPGAHYMVGGLKVDLDGRTSVPGLLAVGECASSGLHGANRMGSNSLLEGIVLGRRSGQMASAARAQIPQLESSGPTDSDMVPPGVGINLEDVTYSLKSLMWRQLGIERDEASMLDAIEKIELWTRAVQDLTAPAVRSFELLNMLTVARLVAQGALARQESRGVHFRRDFPALSKAKPVHIELLPKCEDGAILGIEVATAPSNELTT